MDDLSDSDHEMQESESESSEENHDRLSELPSSLILHILSFLPMKDVVSTTLLSKRWNNLWTTVPTLNFIDFIENNPERVRNFVNRALMFWKGARIKKFKMDFGTHFDGSLYGDVDLWVRFAKENRVEELYMHLIYAVDFIAPPHTDDVIMMSKEVVYGLPQCLYSCSSIGKLSLVGCNLQIHGPPQWNQLKSLRIDGYCFSEHVINQILLGTPQLEVFVLRLMESFENLNIRSSSLKKLTIEKYFYFFNEDAPSTETVLRIWCPNLETLNLSGVLYSKYLLMNVSSLTDVTLGFDGSQHYLLSGEDLLGGRLRQIFPTIRHVEKVTLSNWCVEVLGAMEKISLPSPLPNVEFLELDVRTIKLDEMVKLLEIFPKRKLLVIEHKKDPILEEVIYKTFHENLFFHVEPPEFDAENLLDVVEPLEFDAENQLDVVEPLEFDAENQLDVVEPIEFDAENQLDVVEPIEFDAENQLDVVEPLEFDAENQLDVVEPLEFDAENQLESQTSLPKSILLQLRTVQITTSLYDDYSVLPLAEFLLKNASTLEKLVIRARVTISQESLLQAAEELLSMPRSSPTAMVILCKK